MNQSVREPQGASDTSRPEPTTKQAEVLDLMMASLREHQCYPTLCEMSEALGISVNALLGRLELLEAKGWIERGTAKARSYRIPGLTVGLHLSGQTWNRQQVSEPSTA